MDAQFAENQDHPPGTRDAGQRLHPLHQVRAYPQSRLTRVQSLRPRILSGLKSVFPFRDPADFEGLQSLLDFLLRFERPAGVLKGIVKLLKSGDPLVAPPETFLRRRPGPQFELWDFPVTAETLIEADQGRLLSLPPGSRRFAAYRAIVPDILDFHLQTRFPRLLAELANRPNLFFPGVYFPQELDISNMEMISALHGTFYVVHAELEVGGRREAASVVLKPTDMALESIVTFTLQFIHRRLDPSTRARIGPIIAPTIVAIDDTYGILDLMPGKNGVEFLPRGIKTGTIMDLKSNEYPPDLDLTRDEVLQIAREFAKQAVMAYYLRLYDRKPDQLMIHRSNDPAAGPGGRPPLMFAHIDFGRALKRNYALSWKRHYDPSRPPLIFYDYEIPYFESAAAFIYLPHFIPAALRSELTPFAGPMRETIVETFVQLAGEVKAGADDIHSLFTYLIGRQTQYRPTEVNDVCVDPEDVEEVYLSLITLEDPREIIDSILNLAYHEREGTASAQIESDDTDGGIYRRALVSGDRVTRLRDRTDGPFPYRLVDYRKQGRVSYDAEQKKLNIEFGERPGRVIDHIEANFSKRLAGYIRQFPGDPRGVALEISSDGTVMVRKMSSDERVGMRRKLNFPQEIMREIHESGSGFSPGSHVLAHAAEFKKSPEAPDYLQDEIAKQRLILANDLEGKEILQFMMAIEPDGSPLRAAMAEMVTYHLANPDFLADKDPFESINPIVLSLGRKHLTRLWPGGGAMIEEFLTKDFIGRVSASGAPSAGASDAGRLDDRVAGLLRLYEGVDLSHHVHLILTVRFADELGRRAALDPADVKLLQLSAILHDLNVLDTNFREVLMEPSGRLSRPVLAAVLDRHADIAAERAGLLLEQNRIALPEGVSAETILRILKTHHQPGSRIHQILHLADNIAVFADRTRPDHWNRGFLRLEDIAPRWIDAQLERSLIDRDVWSAAQGFFSDPDNHALLRRLDRMSAFYPQVFSALQMAASLHSGLNPQHPNPMADLRERHGREIVDTMFENLMKSGLSVRDKIKVLNRTDAIAPMLRAAGISAFAFINAGAQPVQRVVELIARFVSESRVVILMGVLPRVIKTYERFRAGRAGKARRADLEQVCVIAGERRLQFVTHSYPYEADFKMPFHKIIRTYREANRIEEPCCLMPFERFMESYAPTADPEARVRKLEKASAVEELRGSDRVREEAERYLKWEASHKGVSFDDRSKERFRRILLSGFANRDVLLFYEETVHGDPTFKNALREVIGALRENPNYLSDRSVYYSIQELVRSLGQIHFYGDDPPTAALRKFLQDRSLAGCVKTAAFLDFLKPQFNFVKHHLAASLQIAVDLGRSWGRTGGLAEDDWKQVAAGTLLAGSLLADEALADYVLSPEDISSNRALRHLLAGTRVSLASLVEKRHDLDGALKSADRARLMRMLGADALEEEDVIPFLLIHTGLVLGSFCDFSRVENWKRGKVRILPEDLEYLWEFLETEFKSVAGIAGRPGAGAMLDRFGARMREFCRKDGPDLLNRHAQQSHSYVRLFNALSLAAELRYGLKARGFDLFHHVRTIYGTGVADPLVDGIMSSDFPLREKVKFARKLRILAAAVTAERDMPSRLMFLHTDHPLGVPPLEDVRTVTRGGSRMSAPLLVPAGDYERTERMFLNLRQRLTPEEFQMLRRRAKFLVGEEYPLLIKEKSLQKTDEFQKRITAFRQRRHLAGRYIFIPAGELLELKKAQEPRDWKDTGGPREKGLFFFRAWMRLFE